MNSFGVNILNLSSLRVENEYLQTYQMRFILQQMFEKLYFIKALPFF